MRREAADNPAAAIGCVILGVGLLTSGDVIAKTVTAHLTPFAYIFLRSMFAFLPVLAALTIARCWGRLRTRHPWAQAARGLSMAVAYNCYLQALQAMPIADVTALFFIAPFLVAPLSHFFLGERVPLSRWIAIAVAFAGVLVIVQPGTDAFRPEGLWCIAGALAAAPVAFGANCGLGAGENIASVVGVARAAWPGAIIVAKANCGIPVWKGDSFIYSGTPEIMAAYARLARDASGAGSRCRSSRSRSPRSCSWASRRNPSAERSRGIAVEP